MTDRFTPLRLFHNILWNEVCMSMTALLSNNFLYSKHCSEGSICINSFTSSPKTVRVLFTDEEIEGQIAWITCPIGKLGDPRQRDSRAHPINPCPHYLHLQGSLNIAWGTDFQPMPHCFHSKLHETSSYKLLYYYTLFSQISPLVMSLNGVEMSNNYKHLLKKQKTNKFYSQFLCLSHQRWLQLTDEHEFCLLFTQWFVKPWCNWWPDSCLYRNLAILKQQQQS